MGNCVLYLEDDPALAHVTCRALQRRGFDIAHYDSITEFRRALNEVEFTHALLDLKIGQDNSLALIQEIKRIKEVPIVVLTGYGSIRTAVQAMKLGAVDFLSKPCGINEILAALVLQKAPEELDLDLEKPSLKATEWETIQKALDDNDGNIAATARQLKMHRRTLQRKLSKRQLDS